MSEAACTVMSLTLVLEFDFLIEVSFRVRWPEISDFVLVGRLKVIVGAGIRFLLVIIRLVVD